MAALCAALAAPGGAEAKDVLFVVLEDDKGDTSAHYQPSSDCMKFLAEFQRLRREGVPTYLKFGNPPADGKVLEVHCVRPDGSVVGERGRRR
jgi:hypothetical protein